MVSNDILDKELNVQATHLIGIVFVLGLAVGFSTGMAVSGAEIPNKSNVADTTEQSSQEPIEVMKDIADNAGIDSSGMQEYVETTGNEEINEEKSNIARAAGRMGTPTFFIGNSEIGYIKMSGAQPFPRMEPVIERKLEEASSGNSTIPESEYKLENISFEGEPVMGEESASVNIIEYSDYSCPWCAEWHGVDAIPQRPIDRENSFQKVQDNYVDSGKVRFVAKDYPVPRLHPEAMTAHKAANYVWKNSPENFWEFSQKLYEERDRW